MTDEPREPAGRPAAAAASVKARILARLGPQPGAAPGVPDRRSAPSPIPASADVRSGSAGASGEHSGQPVDVDAAIRDFIIGPISPELEALLAAPGARAAVLLGLVERGNRLTVLLTERARHLKIHAGQIAFPGGRIEPTDRTAVDAALREAAEEVGLGAADVSVAGQLPPHVTGTGFIVTPIVGFIAGGFVPRPDPLEVADVFEVPLEFLLDEANLEEHRRERYGTLFRSFEFRYGGRRIWGATAAMLVTFLKIIHKQ